MRSLLSLALALSLCASPAAKQEAKADPATAEVLTARYAASRFESWNVRAFAAGPRCDVLRVDVEMVLEDAIVDAMYFGEGAYDVYDGGVRQFAGERAFRGVAFVDKTGKVWMKGDVPASLEKCGD